MAWMQKKTPEQQEAEAAAKEAERVEAAARYEEEKARAKARKEAAQREKQRQAFFESPTGQARMAFERDDVVFQCAVDVMSQQAIIVSMLGSDTKQSTNDPAYVLNQICREGWDLVTGSFVFIEQEQESRDKFMSTGQNVAIKGKTVGYYLFKRCPENRREVQHSWETAATS
jgi:hypothetical protein